MNISKKRIVAAIMIVTVGCMFALPTQSRSLSSDVREAQTIMTKFGLPTGPVDGIWGRQTARGLCAFRSIAGLPGGRNPLTAADIDSLRNYNATYSSIESIPAPARDGATTYLVADKTCQAMAYVEDGRYMKVMAISTGMSGFDFLQDGYSHALGGTNKGWSCSSEYPESCTTQTSGRFASVSNQGNMYNKRHVTGGIYVHGSTSVPTYPASHGCIRVTVADSDWMYDHVGNHGQPTFYVVGQY